jgi:hypothetical protein
MRWRNERAAAEVASNIGAVCIGLDEFADREAVRGLFRRDDEMLAHQLVSSFKFAQAQQERS